MSKQDKKIIIGASRLKASFYQEYWTVPGSVEAMNIRRCWRAFRELDQDRSDWIEAYEYLQWADRGRP